jgi:hypothetical protein
MSRDIISCRHIQTLVFTVKGGSLPGITTGSEMSSTSLPKASSWNVQNYKNAIQSTYDDVWLSFTPALLIRNTSRGSLLEDLQRLFSDHT